MDTRLIVDEPARGSWNMAVDEALLQWAGTGSGAALRFYQWDEPTLSLGYFQRYEARGAHPSVFDLPVVRRTTGGGAIVHHRELTYSFVTPVRNRFASGIQGFVRQFHDSLIATLEEYGIEATLCGDAKAQPDSEPFLCFQRRSSLDILVNNAKVAGSAQRRRRSALLQHGSVLLARSPNAKVLPGLAELSGVTVSPRALVRSWSQRLGNQFGFEFEASTLTESEFSHATEIERNRFAHETWTRKR